MFSGIIKEDVIDNWSSEINGGISLIPKTYAMHKSRYVTEAYMDLISFMRHVYNGTDFINYVLCEICTTKLFVICVLYFVRNDKIKMFYQ